MSRPCDHDGGPEIPGCRVCWLYHHDPAYRALWDGTPPPAPAPRSLPCVYLGEILDRLGCACPGRWVRGCGLHGSCTLERCKACPDYDPDG